MNINAWSAFVGFISLCVVLVQMIKAVGRLVDEELVGLAVLTFCLYGLLAGMSIGLVIIAIWG